MLFVYYLLFSANSFADLWKIHWHYPLAGIFLSAHLITWIASLQITSIASSIFLEGTHPVFAVLVSMIFLGERPHIKTIPAFAVALAGMFLIVYADWNIGESKLAGDFLAILSAIFLAFYLLIARYHRQEKDIVKYLIHVYGAAAVVTGIYMLISGDAFTGFSDQSWLMMALLAVGPNLLGHSLLNWASRKMEIFKVNLTLLLEPVLATLSGMILIAEFPHVWFYPGAILIIASIGFLIIQNNRETRSG